MDLVYVKNTGTTPLPLPHDGQGDVTLRPGEQKILPLEYINVHFGNPSARNEGKNKVRDDTYAKVRVRWGYYDGLETEADWERKRPQFEVHTLDGERVYTVLEDPTGTKATPTLDDTLPGDAQYVNARIAELSQQIERLTAIIASQQSGTMTPTRPTADDVVAHQVGEHLQAMGLGEPESTAADVQVDSGAVPSPPAREKPVGKDAPRTPRVGSRVTPHE